MTDPLTFAMAKIALGARPADGLKSLKESVEASQVADPGRVFDRGRTLKESRAHVFPGVEYTTKNSNPPLNDPVEYPLVNAFQNLYGDKSIRVLSMCFSTVKAMENPLPAFPSYKTITHLTIMEIPQ